MKNLQGLSTLYMLFLCIFIANYYYLNIQAWLFFPWPRHELLCNSPDKNQDSVTKNTYNLNTHSIIQLGNTNSFRNAEYNSEIGWTWNANNAYILWTWGTITMQYVQAALTSQRNVTAEIYHPVVTSRCLGRACSQSLVPAVQTANRGTVFLFWVASSPMRIVLAMS